MSKGREGPKSHDRASVAFLRRHVHVVHVVHVPSALLLSTALSSAAFTAMWSGAFCKTNKKRWPAVCAVTQARPPLLHLTRACPSGVRSNTSSSAYDVAVIAREFEPRLAVFIQVDWHPLSVCIETPTRGRGGCSRIMAVLSPTADQVDPSVTHQQKLLMRRVITSRSMTKLASDDRPDSITFLLQVVTFYHSPHPTTSPGSRCAQAGPPLCCSSRAGWTAP